MRKLFVVLALVFVVAFGFGAVTPDTAEAIGGGGGGGSCYFTCDCAGQPLYCCPTQSGGVSCKPTTLFECPQIYEC